MAARRTLYAHGARVGLGGLMRTLLVLLLLVVPTSALAQSDFNLIPAAKPFGGQLTLNNTNGGEALAAATLVVSVSLKAACANTVSVMVGGSTLNYSSAKSRTLAPCETLDMDIDNLVDVYVDAGTTASQVMEYIAVRKR